MTQNRLEPLPVGFGALAAEVRLVEKQPLLTLADVERTGPDGDLATVTDNTQTLPR